MPCSPAPGHCAATARAGVLVELVKPGQDRRVDLPTLGLATDAGRPRGGATRHRLRGRRLPALNERAESIAEADAAGMFLLGLTPQQIGEHA